MFHVVKADYEKNMAMTALQIAEKPYVSVKTLSGVQSKCWNLNYKY